MNKLQDWLGKTPARVALLLYLSVGLIQLGIIPFGLEVWLGIPVTLGLMCAAILAWIPILGQALGLATVVDALNWPVVPSAILFLWPVWFLGMTFMVRRLRRRREIFAREAELFNRRFDTAGAAQAATRNPVGEMPPRMRAGHPFRSAA